MKNFFKAFVLIYLLLTMWGCSLFNPPTPKQDVRITRSAVNGRGEIRPSDLVSMPETWGNGTLYFRMREEFQPLLVGTDPSGQPIVVSQEIMSSRDVEVMRVSDASVAAQVAMHQHSYAASTADKITDTVGTAIVAGATGGAGAAPLVGGSIFDWMKGLAESAKTKSTNAAPAPPSGPPAPPANASVPTVDSWFATDEPVELPIDLSKDGSTDDIPDGL